MARLRRPQHKPQPVTQRRSAVSIGRDECHEASRIDLHLGVNMACLPGRMDVTLRSGRRCNHDPAWVSGATHPRRDGRREFHRPYLRPPPLSRALSAAADVNAESLVARRWPECSQTIGPVGRRYRPLAFGPGHRRRWRFSGAACWSFSSLILRQAPSSSPHTP